MLNKDFKTAKNIPSLANISQFDTITLIYDTIGGSEISKINFYPDSLIMFSKAAKKESIEYSAPVINNKDTAYQNKKEEIMWVGGEFGKWYIEKDLKTICIAMIDSDHNVGEFVRFSIINNNTKICLIKKSK